MEAIKKRKFLRRRQYIINQDFQFRHVGAIIAIVSLTCLIFVLAAKYYIGLNLDPLIESGLISSPIATQLINIEKQFLNRNLLTIFFGLIASLTIISIWATHRIAGPLFVLRRRMKQITKEGFPKEDLRVRKGDEFQDLVDDFNVMVKSLQKNAHKSKNKRAA